MTTSFPSLIKGLKVGSSVAELEANSNDYFIRTEIFHEIVNDRIDLVLGHKGSGKSTLFLALVTPREPIPELQKTDVLPAFDLKESLAFRGLRGNRSPSGLEANTAWKYFLVDYVTLHIIENYRTHSATKAIRELRELIGLEGSLKPTKRLRAFFKRMFDPDPLIVGAKSTNEVPTPEDIDEVFTECRRFLATVGRRVWIVFDRLDEAFYETPGLERTLLRELLAVIRETNGQGSTIQIKAFLRNDIFVRLSKKGKERIRTINATHIRKAEISWPRDQMVALITHRLLEFNPALRFMAQSASEFSNSIPFLDQILPGQTPDNFDYWPAAPTDTFSWILLGTAFEGGQSSPRNVLDFFHQCKLAQQVWDENHPTEAEQRKTLFSVEALHRAAHGVSRLRYGDTLTAEFLGIAELVLKLRSGPTHYPNRKAVFRQLRVSDDEGRHAFELLEESGLVEVDDSVISITPLYRPELETTKPQKRARQ